MSMQLYSDIIGAVCTMSVSSDISSSLPFSFVRAMSALSPSAVLIMRLVAFSTPVTSAPNM